MSRRSASGLLWVPPTLGGPSCRRRTIVLVSRDAADAPQQPVSASPGPQGRLPNTGGLRELPFITPANELASRARKRAYLVKPDKTIKNARQQARKVGAMKLDTLTKEISVPLRDVVEGYRRQLRRLHPYESVVADLTVRALEKCGGATLGELLEKVKGIHKEVVAKGKAQASRAKQASTAAEALSIVEEGTEEVLSIMGRSYTQELLLEMLEVQKALKRVPVVELDTPTIVLVGAPNVGKSSIIRAISTGTPEVNNYPFTTRGVTMGHMFEEHEAHGDWSTRYQIMDTPGVLARDDDLRNEMESLTIASLQYLPTAVMFVVDLSGLSGDDKSSVEDQCLVRRELRQRFPRRPWLDVVSKADLDQQPGALDMFREIVAQVDHGRIEDEENGENRGNEPASPRAVDAILEVSVVSGEGLGELEKRVRRMLVSVKQVLRAYKESQKLS